MSIQFNGLDDVIKDIQEETKYLPANAKAILSDLSVIALNEMSEFKHPAGDYDYNDTVVEKTDTENGVSITASGDNVLFIEYGAGNSAESPLGHGFEGPALGPGSYSKDHKREYTRYGSWHHNKKKYTSQPANRFAVKAYERVVNNIEKVARRVFA